MKVIYNNIIPFSGFAAMTFFNIIFIRKSRKSYYEQRPDRFDIMYNHESIHEAQMKDFCSIVYLGGIIFYIYYFFEWLYRVLFTKDIFSSTAYKHISFEQEAYNNETNFEYLKNRERFAQWN